MTMRAFTLVAIAGALLGSACTLDQPTPGELTGPSTFATAVSVTATPDLINLGESVNANGQSSVITVRVLDKIGQPKAAQPIRLDMFVGNIMEDCGHLQARNLVTDTNGQATTLFTAPGTPVPMPECTGFVPGGTITVRATPVGTNAQQVTSSSASIRVISPTFITPVGGLTVNFSISPNPKVAPALVTFSDAGSSSPGHSIVSYFWNFSDGATKVGSVVTHDFFPAASYTVTLTIVDDIGQTAFKTVSFTVSP